MASQIGDGDYLAAYRRFFVDFLGKVNPDDQLPIKTGGHDVTEGEIVGEIVHMTLQYLDQQLCPPSLQCYIAQLVIEEIKATCRKQPETCGFRQEDKTYEPLKLMQAVTGKVNEICQRYLENSRLALLPPPPSTPMPLATAFAIRNNRRKMEDRHVILHDLNTIFNIKDDSIASYYAVFDGHAGYQAAVFCATHLHQYLAESLNYPTDPERALRDAFLTTDARFIDKSTRQTLSSGTTAVCALILNRKLYVAWAGDSQAALAKRGMVTQLVNPHKPDRNDERERVEEMGGTVMHLGIWRVNGNLAVSRAIGDAQYKPYVTGDPEIRCITLDGQEDFLIIACDGLWDCVTENEAAALVYRHLYWDPYDYGSTSQRLVEYAKNQGSIDNITVIVVFLATPRQIASRSTYGNPLLADVQMNNMEPDNRYLSNANGQYEVNSTFVKQQPTANNGSSSDMMLEDQYGNYGNKSSNGKSHENGDDQVADYDVEEEEEDDDEEEEEDDDDDDDLGPETDVDAVDDVSEPVPATLADVSRQLFTDKPDPSELNRNDECMDEDSTPSPNLATQTQKQSVIPDTDNVADSEDSEDEWNYYRIDPNKEKAEVEETGAAGFSSVPKIQDELLDKTVPSTLGEHEDKSFETPYHAAGDSSSDSENSAREIRENVLIESEVSALTNPLESSSATKDIESESEEEKLDDHMEKKIRDEEGKKEGDESSNMDFQLNPNAAEFVPVSPTLTMPIKIGNDGFIPGPPLKQTPPMDDMTMPMRMCLDKLIAGSPLKQTPPMDDILVPSKCDFENEIRNRPHEIEEKSCPNGELYENLDETTATSTSEKATGLEEASAFNLDESEVSSTKAEFGDESSYLMGSGFPKTDASNFDRSFTGSYTEFDDSTVVDPMTKSFGPGEFVALGNPVDLNAVHDLTDADLMLDEDEGQVPQPADGIIEQSDEKIEQNNIRNMEIDTEFKEIDESSIDPYAASQSDKLLDSCPMSVDNPTVNETPDNFGVEENAQISHTDFDFPESKVSHVEPEVEESATENAPGFDESGSNEPTSTLVPEAHTETDVSSKLLEMDLEDRGSQDCGFEKCNEKWQNESEVKECTTTRVSEEPIQQLSSTTLEENITGESDLLSAEHHPPEIPNIEESHETKEDTVPSQESFMLNPLDLNVVTSSSVAQDNVILEDDSFRVNSEIPKGPESPDVGVSPLIEDPPMNSFNQMDLVNFLQPQEEQERPPSAEEHLSEQKNLLEDESPLECVTTEETADVSVGLKLSESLQEFTGLEQQLNPEKVSNGVIETGDNLMDVCSDPPEETSAPEVPIPALSSEEIEKKISELAIETETKTIEEKPESMEKANDADAVLEATAVAAAAVGAASVAAAAAAVTAPKTTTKTKPAGKVPPKAGATTKAGVGGNKSTPTSPTKPSTARTSTAVGAAKKTGATSLAARPNKLETAGKTSASASPSAKSSATTATKSTVKTTAKPTGRSLATTGAAASATGLKAKPLTSTTKSTALGEKKPTSNGDATKSSLSTTSRVSSTNTRSSTATKTLKSSTAGSARANGTTTTTTTTTAPSGTSSRPKTASTTATASSRLTSKTMTSTGTTGTTTQRPKTAPSTGTLAAASSHASKTRLVSTTKSPITEKQIKETANKQISSSRTTTTSTSTRSSRVTASSSTTRRVTATKSTSSSTATTNNTAAPAMPPPIKKPGSVARVPSAPSKNPTTNGKINSAKTNSTTVNKTKVVVENGVSIAEQDVLVVTSTTATEMTTTTTTMMTNNSNEEDVPKKDFSPIEPTTDNQLIVTAD